MFTEKKPSVRISSSDNSGVGTERGRRKIEDRKKRIKDILTKSNPDEIEKNIGVISSKLTPGLEQELDQALYDLKFPDKETFNNRVTQLLASIPQNLGIGKNGNNTIRLEIKRLFPETNNMNPKIPYDVYETAAREVLQKLRMRPLKVCYFSAKESKYNR